MITWNAYSIKALTVSLLTVHMASCADVPEGNLESADTTAIATFQAAPADPEAPVLGQVRAMGKGCPAGTWAVEPELRDPLLNGAFTIIFQQFTAKLSATSNPADALTHCNITVPITSPKGLQFAVTKFRYRGYAELEPGVTLVHSADYRFAGTPAVAAPDKVTKRIEGPWRKSFIIQDDLTATNPGLLNWSTCTTQATIVINARVGLVSAAPPRMDSILAVEAVDGNTAKLEVGLTSKACSL